MTDRYSIDSKIINTAYKLSYELCKLGRGEDLRTRLDEIAFEYRSNPTVEGEASLASMISEAKRILAS